MQAIREFPQPVIARLNGVALGGGAELALACDMRVAAPHAAIGFIHGRLAITPSWGGTFDLIQLLGHSNALKLMARAEILTASQAFAMRMVDHVTEEGAEFDAEFVAYIDEMLRRPGHVLRAYKKAIRCIDYRIASMDVEETEAFARSWTHQDHWLALSASTQERK